MELTSGIMCYAEGRPYDNICIHHVLSPLHRVTYTTYLVLALECISSSCEELSIIVLCHPDLMLAELSTTSLDRVWLSKKHLAVSRHELVSHRVTADWVILLGLITLMTLLC